ncbi:MAG: S8 family serine peptidase [Acidimicrobiia bacterium]|nr:S8 family serine peptidase [Acidimicrobiia bacterium]
MSFWRRVPAALALGVLAGGLSSLAVARAAGPSNDYFWDNPPVQWGLLQVGAPAAWGASTGAGVNVGIVDSGVDASHEDLAGKVVDGANCVGSNGNEGLCTSGGTTDVVGHGTHVAGIIAALTGNGIGVASMAPDAHLISAQAVDSGGSGSDADVGAAIRWVVDHGAGVVNLSLGAEATSRVAFGPGFSSAVEYAWSHGAVPVVAAGNSAQTPNFGSLHILVVTATTPNGDVASYSNHVDRATWAVAAPGGAADGNPYHDIVSTYPNNSYATIAGTSMATAHVSGEVALLLAKGYSASGAVQRVLATAVPCTGCGSGRIDAAAALGVGSAPAPSAPPGLGGGAGPPGAATVVGPPPRSVPASRAAPRAAAPRPTAAPTTVTTEPPSPAPTTTSEPGPVEAALGGPWPGQVRIDDTGGNGGAGSNRAAAIGFAVVGLAGAAGALGVRLVRLRGT